MSATFTVPSVISPTLKVTLISEGAYSNAPSADVIPSSDCDL